MLAAVELRPISHFPPSRDAQKKMARSFSAAEPKKMRYAKPSNGLSGDEEHHRQTNTARNSPLEMPLAHSPLETIPDPVSPQASSSLATIPVVANPVSSPISEMYASPVKRGRRAGTTNKQRRDIVTGELKSSGVDVTPLLNRRMSSGGLYWIVDERRRPMNARERLLGRQHS